MCWHDGVPPQVRPPRPRWSQCLGSQDILGLGEPGLEGRKEGGARAGQGAFSLRAECQAARPLVRAWGRLDEGGVQGPSVLLAEGTGLKQLLDEGGLLLLQLCDTLALVGHLLGGQEGSKGLPSLRPRATHPARSSPG